MALGNKSELKEIELSYCHHSICLKVSDKFIEKCKRSRLFGE